MVWAGKGPQPCSYCSGDFFGLMDDKCVNCGMYGKLRPVDVMDKRYRITDPYHDNGEPELEVWYVVRKTEHGAWIAPRWRVTGFDATTGKGIQWDTLKRRELELEGARFVLDGNGKRWAHESEEWARDSYRIRKEWQIRHAKRSIARAENALHWLKTGRSFRQDVMSLGQLLKPPA